MWLLSRNYTGANKSNNKGAVRKRRICNEIQWKCAKHTNLFVDTITVLFTLKTDVRTNSVNR